MNAVKNLPVDAACIVNTAVPRRMSCGSNIPPPPKPPPINAWAIGTPKLPPLRGFALLVNPFLCALLL